MRWLLLVLWALSAEADFFQLDSLSNVSTYYFNYFYCSIWEGDCQPHQDDASQQGKRGAERQKTHTEIICVAVTSMSACRDSSYQGPLGRLSPGLHEPPASVVL